MALMVAVVALSSSSSSSLPSPSSSSSPSSSAGSCRKRTWAATDRSEGSESGHSGCILLMSDGTPRTTLGNVTATVGSLTRGGEDDSGTIHSEKSKSKENRNDAKDY